MVKHKNMLKEQCDFLLKTVKIKTPRKVTSLISLIIRLIKMFGQSLFYIADTKANPI